MYGSGQENSTVLVHRVLSGEVATMTKVRAVLQRTAAAAEPTIRTIASVSVSDFGSNNEELYKGS